MILEEIKISKIETAYNRVKEISEDLGLEVKRFPDISNDVVLVGNIVLVWLTNIHYRDITFDGTKANERDRGYKNLKTLLQNMKEEQDTFEKNITTPVAISRFMYREDHLKNKIKRILDKK